MCFNGSITKAHEAYERTKQLDTLKNAGVKEHPEDVLYFIRFSHQEPVTKEYALYKLVEAGVPMFYLIDGMSTFS